MTTINLEEYDIVIKIKPDMIKLQGNSYKLTIPKKYINLDHGFLFIKCKNKVDNYQNIEKYKDKNQQISNCDII